MSSAPSLLIYIGKVDVPVKKNTNKIKTYIRFSVGSFLMSFSHKKDIPKKQKSIITLQYKETASVLDISKHSKTFIAIFDAIYGGGGKEHYDRYFTNSIAKNAEKYDSKLLKQCYKIIKNCVNIQCSFFNESPAPYITDYDKPLTVDPVLIELSELDTNSVLQEASREFRSQK